MDYFLFVLLAPLAAAALLASVVSVLPLRRTPATRPLLAAGACIAGWLLFNTAEALAVAPESKLLWASLTYVFIATAPLAWLTFTIVYTDHSRWLGWKRLALLSVIPVATIALVFTNEAHGLIWRSYSFYEVPAPAFGPLPPAFLGIQVVHGPAYWLFAFYAYACLIASSVLIIQEHLRSFSIYRRQSAWMVCATLAPFAANLIYLAGLVPGLRKDFAPLAFAFGTGIFAIIVRRHGLLDLKPVARNLLVDRMRDAMLVLDASDRIVDFNPEAAALFGLDADAVIGRNVALALRPEHRSLAEHLDGARQERAELRLPAGDGPRYYELRATPLADPNGRVSGRLLVLNDVTQRTEHEEMLRQANLKLAREYEAMHAFSHTVAHDLTNPVHTIVGFSELLDEDYDLMPDDQRRETIQAVMRTAHKMHQIIRELLLLARVGAGPVQREPVDMAAVAAEVLERLRPEIQTRKADVAMPDQWPAALGYAPWIEEVWSNYLGNALKHAGSRPHVELGYTLACDAVRFWVRDFGPGVPLDKQARLFVPFSRLGEEKAEGHGLGLSIVRRIMEALGGGFGIESSGISGQGSLFYFTLPLAPSTGASDLDGPLLQPGPN